MQVETLKAGCIFIQSCISFWDKNLEKKYTKLMGAWLHTVWFLRIQIYTKTQENLCIFWNRVENQHIYHLMSAFGSPKWVLHKQRKIEFSTVLSVFFRNYRQMTWYDDYNELWRASTAISFKYMKDLQTLKAWNGRNMYYNLTMSELRKKTLITFFRHQLILQFYRGLRKTILKVPEGIQHFPREGSKFFQGGGGCLNANFYRNQ